MKATLLPVIVYGTAAVAVGGLAWYAWSNRDKVRDALNPASDKNLAYRGANALLQFVTGNKTDTLGTLMASRASDAAGEAAIAPTLVRSKTDHGIEFDEFLANARPARPGSLPIDGSGGAAFGLYPNPFRSH